MQAFVYKSQRKSDAYVYLAARDGFDVLPPALQSMLGTLQFVLELEMSPERKLARVDAKAVIEQLQNHGFFVQMPTIGDWSNPIMQQNSKLSSH